MHKYKIIGKTDIVFCFQNSFHILIEFVHVDVHQQLAGEIAEWQANGGFANGTEAINDLRQKSHDVFIINVLC